MSETFLRREAAANYLRARYGIGSRATLAKLAVLGGGPAFRKMGRIPGYTHQDLDSWASARLSKVMRSTSDTNEASL